MGVKVLDEIIASIKKRDAPLMDVLFVSQGVISRQLHGRGAKLMTMCKR